MATAFTSGPFQVPSSTNNLHAVILNNDPNTAHSVQVAVFQLDVLNPGTPNTKTLLASPILTVQPLSAGRVLTPVNTATSRFYEVQVIVDPATSFRGDPDVFKFVQARLANNEPTDPLVEILDHQFVEFNPE